MFVDFWRGRISSAPSRGLESGKQIPLGQSNQPVGRSPRRGEWCRCAETSQPTSSPGRQFRGNGWWRQSDQRRDPGQSALQQAQQSSSFGGSRLRSYRLPGDPAGHRRSGALDPFSGGAGHVPKSPWNSREALFTVGLVLCGRICRSSSSGGRPFRSAGRGKKIKVWPSPVRRDSGRGLSRSIRQHGCCLKTSRRMLWLPF